MKDSRFIILHAILILGTGITTAQLVDQKVKAENPLLPIPTENANKEAATVELNNDSNFQSEEERLWLLPTLLSLFTPRPPLPPPTPPVPPSIIFINLPQTSTSTSTTTTPTTTTTSTTPTTTTTSTTPTTTTTTTSTTTTTRPPPPSSGRTIIFHNRCAYPIWISPQTNNNGPELAPGIGSVPTGGSFTYNIPDGGWAGRMWPKSGCDASGQNCVVGQAIPPCPANGCDPPADTKVEFFFPQNGAASQVWYDISLVDGYNLATQIIPSVQQGNCTTTDCAVSLSICPTNENGVGSLVATKNGNPVYCLSPCKKWNSPSPFGLGNPETQQPGLDYCCPTPPVTPQQCSSGPVIHTQYVQLIHRVCPSAYSYAYDDLAGLHTCPSSVSFTVNIC